MGEWCRHAGAIPRLVRVLLESPDLISQERAIWTLNNMCAKSSDIQHMIRHEGGLDAVMRVLETATDRGRIKAALACIFHLAESPANQDAIRTQGTPIACPEKRSPVSSATAAVRPNYAEK